jgi:hypothetical protein
MQRLSGTDFSQLHSVFLQEGTLRGNTQLQVVSKGIQ